MTEIPGYTILRPLGHGGMASVVLAVQESLGREVALKILSPSLAQDPEFGERFLREARIAASLHHPHIVAIFDVGMHAGTAFMAMAYEPGGTVAPLVEARIEPAAALKIVRDVADALDHAHAQGVIHRDVKPDNILRRRDGACLLSDFGIACAIATNNVITRAGVSLGTPQYMSPEQLRGEPLDGRADLYALGVVLYELLTGSLPYHGADAWAIGYQHVHAPVPRLPATLARLQPLVDALLAKEPSHRPQTGRDVAARIDALLDGRTAAPTVALTPPQESMPAPAPAPPPRRRPARTATAVLLALLLAAVAVFGWQYRPAGEPVVPPPSLAAAGAPSIAVLPFVDLSAAQDQGYFADGMTTELIGLLARIPGVRVAGRTSSFAFKGKATPLPQIARELHVATLLEGSVRRDGNHVRITTQLIGAADGYPLWSETYDREVLDVFTVQDEIAQAVVAALKIRLLASERRTLSAYRTTSPEAYTQYLLGQQFLGRANPDDFARAAAAFERAVALDPQFAAAHAGLVFAHVSSLQFADTLQAPSALLQRAQAAAERALELDPYLADAHAARGLLRATITWEWIGAETDYERALALNPSDSDTHRRYGLLHAARGRLDAAIASTRRSLELDPLSGPAWNNLGYLCNATGNYACAREALERALEVNPERVASLFNLGVTELLQDRPGVARALFERIPDGQQFRLLGMALVQHAMHDDAASSATLEQVRALPGHSPFWLATVHARRNEPDAAFDALQRGLAERDYFVKQAGFDPLLQPLRNDPRYAQLLDRLGLSPGR